MQPARTAAAVSSTGWPNRVRHGGRASAAGALAALPDLDRELDRCPREAELLPQLALEEPAGARLQGAGREDDEPRRGGGGPRGGHCFFGAGPPRPPAGPP